MKIRYIGKRCSRCKKNSMFGFPDNGQSQSSFLESEGWKKIKDRWVCPLCSTKQPHGGKDESNEA